MSDARLYFDGKQIIQVPKQANIYIGSYDGSTYKYGWFVPKGTVVTNVGNGYGTYNIKFYSLK